MAVTGIIREATEAERKDYTEIGRMNFEQTFMSMLRDKEAACTKAHKPFDRKGAHYDFQDKKDEIIKRFERMYGSEAIDKITFEDFKMDLEKYADASRFKLLDESEVREDKLLDGIRVSVITGKWQNYQCVNHKGRISVFVPLETLKTVEDIRRSELKPSEVNVKKF